MFLQERIYERTRIASKIYDVLKINGVCTNVDSSKSILVVKDREWKRSCRKTE